MERIVPRSATAPFERAKNGVLLTDQPVVFWSKEGCCSQRSNPFYLCSSVATSDQRYNDGSHALR
jgi:hypothetical protein